MRDENRSFVLYASVFIVLAVVIITASTAFGGPLPFHSHHGG
ncbi:hypothetical protein ACSBLW_05550 [Thioclava sp. FR2]